MTIQVPKAVSDPSCVQDWRSRRLLFPLQHGTKEPARGCKWPEVATNDPTVIADYGRVGRDLAIKCGEQSDLFVIDEDAPGALAALEKVAGIPLPTTHIVHTSIDPATGFQKRQHYFTHPRIPNQLKNRVKIFGGIDIRREGGYVVAEGARHIADHQYESQDDLSPVELPVEFIRAIETAQREGNSKSGVSAASGKVKKGQRNDFLTRKAGTLRSTGLNRELLDQALQLINSEQCEPPLPASEVSRIAASIAQYAPNEAKEKARPKPKCFIVSAKSMAAIANEVKFWLWLNVILSSEVNLFVGDPDVGKTLVTILLIACVTTGDDFPLGGVNKLKKPRKVLIYCTEDSYNATWKPRLIVAGADIDMVIPIFGVGTSPDDEKPLPLSLDQREHREAVQELLTENPEVALVLFDPLSQMVGKLDLFKPEIREVLAGLTDIARAANVSIILIHHTNKQQVDAAIKSASGSFQIMAAVQNCWLFAIDPEVEKRFLMMQVRNKAGQKRSFKYRILGKDWPQGFEPDLEPNEKDDGCGLVEFVGKAKMTADEFVQRTQEKDASANNKAHRWLNELLAHGPVSNNHAWAEAEQRGLSRDVVNKACTQMKIIRKENKWMLPPQSGKEADEPLDAVPDSSFDYGSNIAVDSEEGAPQ